MFLKTISSCQRLKQFTQCRHISALYISGDKAKETYAAITPYMDFQSTFAESTSLEKNLQFRKQNINLAQLIKDYDAFKAIQSKKSAIEQKRRQIADQMRLISKTDEDLIRKLSSEGKELREELKLLKEMSYSFEDSFVHKYLEIPNKLHEKSTTTNQLLHEHLDVTKTEPQPHLSKTDLIEYRDASSFYLKGEAAEFDLKFPFYCTNIFKSHEFVQFCNPDFIRLALVEAANVDANELFQVSEHQGDDFCHINTLHLCGGGSMMSFLGLLSKLTVNPSALPLKFIGIGKQYRGQQTTSKYGLYGTTQSTCVQHFVATKSYADAELEFNNCVHLMIDLYIKLNVHFKVIYVKPENLAAAEQMRASLQMYSSHLDEYLEVGNVSLYGDYISKRLLFNYKEGKDFRFPHTVSGTLCDLPKLIGIMIESGVSWKGPWMND